MAGEGFILQMIQSIRYNRSLKKTRTKRDGPTPGIYTAATHNPIHSPEQIKATIAHFEKKRKAESKLYPFKIALTILLTILIIAGLIYAFYFLRSETAMFEHQDIYNL